jgi:hypothetical protein
VIAVITSCVGLGCTSTTDDKVNRPSTSPTTERAPAPDAATGQATEVAALGLTLDLPTSFEVADDPELALLARTLSPRAILSISSESRSIVNYRPDSGETVDQGTLEGRDTVTVLDANVDGLPPGIVANELLVDNGAESFSLILSSDPESLARLWPPLVESIRFDD